MLGRLRGKIPDHFAEMVWLEKVDPTALADLEYQRGPELLCRPHIMLKDSVVRGLLRAIQVL